jgi:D-alanine-D-alanine ligase
MSNRRVAILVPPEGPETSADQADTFLQAREISECLTILGREALIVSFGPDRADTADLLARYGPAVVVNLVEDVPEGPDQLHLATALLARLGLRHTGAPTAALKALGDKRAMKRALAAAGLPVAADLDASSPGAPTADHPSQRYIVKSALEHASIGLDAGSIVSGRFAAEALIAEKTARFGGVWFAEAYVDGREFNVGLLETAAGPIVLPIAEIHFLETNGAPKIVGYAEKWATESAAYANTPRGFPEGAPDRPLLDELGRLALAAWRLFGLAGYARLDFRVDEAGSPFIVDVNANPCLARDAGFCAAAERVGLSQTDIVTQLIEAALA